MSAELPPQDGISISDVNARVLALSHVLQSMLRVMPPAQKVEFEKQLMRFAPKGQPKAYHEQIGEIRMGGR